MKLPLYSATLIWMFSCGYLPAAVTNPSLRDSDGDGYLDGPDLLENWDGTLKWRIGEDKNGDGRYDRLGPDGAAETADDETDPNNRSSIPRDFAPVETYEHIAKQHDADMDGLCDADEDDNLDGVWQSAGADGIPGNEDDELNFLDADTDDDGLSDGFEMMKAPLIRLPFWFALKNIHPLRPDTDNDGLPDGLELGAQCDASGRPRTMAPSVSTDDDWAPPAAQYLSRNDTDGTRTFRYHNPQTNTEEDRPTFISDQDPLSITDPTNADSNCDGTDDGLSDVNHNGLADAGEIDPAQGWMSHWKYDQADPDRSEESIGYLAWPIVSEQGHIAEDTDTFVLPYQPTKDETDTELLISQPQLFRLVEIVRHPQNRLLFIKIQWLPVNDKAFADAIVEFRVRSTKLPGESTRPIKAKYYFPKNMHAWFSLHANDQARDAKSSPQTTPKPSLTPVAE